MKREMSHSPITKLISSLKRKDNKSIVVKNNLAYYMDLYEVSVEDLASKIGSTPNTINSIISGKYVPSVYLCLLISLFFNTSVNSLFYLDIVAGSTQSYIYI